MVFSRSNIKHFNEQKYAHLRKEACDTGVPFSDPTFPAADSSLVFSGHQNQLPGRVVWKRPSELCPRPLLMKDGPHSCDIVQGLIGNCWFVAACSALAQEKELLQKVVPDYKEQEWDYEHPDSYGGIFHFRFWRFGVWIDVVVDDRLPTVNGELIYTRSHENSEFWGALLEKAYAKLNGCYEALEGGNLSDALVDFTGGISEVIELKSKDYVENEVTRKELFKTLLTEMESHSLMCAAIAAQTKEEMEQRTEVGLVKGHAYGITAVKKVYIGSTGLISFFTGREKIYMVRLRNPWGGCEWNGPFSDGSPEWAKISDSERERIGLTFQEDGEFWMPFDDYIRHFTDMSVCRIINTSWFSFSRTWREATLFGEWTKGPKGSSTDRAGGCINHRSSFLRNPQYRFDIDVDEDTVIMYLLQNDRRSQRNQGARNYVIGFHIMKAEENRKYRIHTIREKAATSDYVRTRGVYLSAKLQRGRYVVVPTTFEPDQEGQFMLRIFTSKDANVKELVKDVPRESFLPCFSYPALVTYVTVRSASGLEKQDRFGSADPYCIMKCEGQSVKTPVCLETLDPVWNTSAIFFRKHADSPIKFQIWNHNIIRDSLMGRASLAAPVAMETLLYELELVGKNGGEEGDKKPGKLVVEVFTSDDLQAF